LTRRIVSRSKEPAIMPQEAQPDHQSIEDPETGDNADLGRAGQTDHPAQGSAESPPTTAELARHVRAWGVFLVAVLIGALFQPQIGRMVRSIFPPSTTGKVLYWTSPMDRSFRSDKPGRDAMGMRLVPVYAGAEQGPEPLRIDPVLRGREFTTTLVRRGPWLRTVRAIGTVTEAEPLVGEVTLKMDAWVEKLFVDYEGQPVHKGDRLLEVYSPELVLSQEELLSSQKALDETTPRSSAVVRREARSNLEAVREKLLKLDVTEQQIDALASKKQVRKTVTFYSPFDGIVLHKAVFKGTYAKAGSLLYQIVDLSRVWVNIYLAADEAHCVRVGQQATMTLSNLPGHAFSGKLIYIYPDLDPKTRTLRVRLEFPNPNMLLKPGMFTNVVLAPHNMGEGLRIDRRAVLRTGTREVVFVSLTNKDSQPTGRFEARQITTGMLLDGNKVQLINGLRAGERIVLSGNFLFDSESRLRSIARKLSELPKRSGGTSPAMRGMGMRRNGARDKPAVR